MDTADINDFISNLEEQIKSGVYFLVNHDIIFCKNVEVAYDSKYGLIIKTLRIPGELFQCNFKFPVALRDVKWSTNEDILLDRLYKLRSLERIINNQN